MKWLILSRLAQQDNKLSPRCDAIFDKNNSIFTLFKINFALWRLNSSNISIVVLLPLRGDMEFVFINPGCRFALPWARCSLPFQGVDTVRDFNQTN